MDFRFKEECLQLYCLVLYSVKCFLLLKRISRLTIFHEQEHLPHGKLVQTCGMKEHFLYRQGNAVQRTGFEAL